LRHLPEVMGFMLAVALICPAQQTSALESDPAGWTDILPGASLKGWTRLPMPPTNPPLAQSQWRVDPASRTLICEGNLGNEWLRYDRELSDAIFHVEWRFTKLPEENARYNSGVYMRNSADGAIWHQAQAGAASGGFLFGNTLVNGERKRVNLRDAATPSRVKPAGEWNTYELSARGKTITLWVNGAVTSVFGECELPRGHIGLEAEGYRIEFRNLKLKELSKER